LGFVRGGKGSVWHQSISSRKTERSLPKF